MIKNAILILLLSLAGITTLMGQNKPDYEGFLSESNGGLCNQFIRLFADSTYCMESGCEASSHFSWGRWTQKKNILTFIPANPATFKLIKKLETQKSDDSKIRVFIYDNLGQNITGRISVGQYVENKGVYDMEPDSSSTQRTDLRRANSKIVLLSLQKIFRQQIEIPTDSSNVYHIYLNISGQWNFNARSDWDETPVFSLIRTPGQLISLRPDTFEKGKMKPKEWILQKK